jgi:dTDP-glucose 4,6-dehydratase
LPVNLGNPTEWTILECAREIQSLVGSNCEIVFKPLPEDDPQQRQPDITKAETLLGWEPKVALHEGLGLSVEYFKKQVKRAS